MKHVGDIKKLERCEKLLWNSFHNPQPFLPFVYIGEDIIELSKKRLRFKETFEGQRGDGNDAFLSACEHYRYFVNVRFVFNDLRVKIPLMIKHDDVYDIGFTFVSCYPKEAEAQRFADSLWVLDNLGIKTNDLFLVHLNADYVRGEEMDIDSLLKISHHFYSDHNRESEEVKVGVERRKRNLTPILNKINQVLDQEKIEKPRTQTCTRHSKCLYFDQCFGTIDDTSIFNLVSSNRKFDLFKQGKDTIDKIDFDDIEGTRHQFAQYMAATNQSLYIDYDAVLAFVSQISYPLSYLDFEWETFAFPPYKGMKPYDALAFQYSLHIENANHELVHLEYLGAKDCRKEFVQQLIKDIPTSGSILCYNVEGAEKLRLRQLAKLYPEYADALKQIWERMIDLSIPFARGLIYDNRMAGMYSLKKLVEIFTDYDYHDLDISHGTQAVREYIRLEKSAQENQELRANLLAYCGMDTYAEYLIYHFILKKLKEHGYA